MVVQAKPLVEITQDALRVLFKELGVVNTVRFLNQFTVGYGDYTEERKQLFADLTLDEVIAEIRRDRGQHDS